MNLRFRSAPAVLALGLFLVGVTTSAQDPPPLPADPPGIDVQARGPVHEAFAEPGTPPAPSPVVAKQPPEPVEELPPDQKPEGDNVQWIPGYWAWDDDASDFLWVSGCWRDIPPGRSWVPGHWQTVDGGWVWVAGFWVAESVTEVQYLPAPPPTLDQGPSNPPPDATSIYVPGAWVYQTSRYLWRPGQWIAYRPGWVWIPASYFWTPSGYVFVDGYWDHPLDERGLLFAPARINTQTFLAARRAYVPRLVVNPDFLLGALFIRPQARHYYFGDYFEPRYNKLGYVAWPDYHPVKNAFDPTFAYYSRRHAADKNWEPALRGLYTARHNGEVPRPPQTFAKQAAALRALTDNKTAAAQVHKNINITNVQNTTVLTPITQVNKTRVTNLAHIGGGKAADVPRELKLNPVQKDALLQQQKAAAALRDAAAKRREAETKVFTDGKVPHQHTDPPHALKLDVPKLPAPSVNPARPPQKPVPAAVVVPKHEERPIPKFEPPKQVIPPKVNPKKGPPEILPKKGPPEVPLVPPKKGPPDVPPKKGPPEKGKGPPEKGKD